ncbi:hypothetical protein QTO34_013420 [Cnephaeus nilssonii]|uniref:non-specific serine/threonine protein kinase n=1 Tax=Cnephaeus nilssonii TaxID=3371016 RepID=A0AA40I801_CNENI|nr:hypothetical protein QTO34_013420 [Eptesicus nilssonii]
MAWMAGTVILFAKYDTIPIQSSVVLCSCPSPSMVRTQTDSGTAPVVPSGGSRQGPTMDSTAAESSTKCQLTATCCTATTTASEETARRLQIWENSCKEVKVQMSSFVEVSAPCGYGSAGGLLQAWWRLEYLFSSWGAQSKSVSLKRCLYQLAVVGATQYIVKLGSLGIWKLVVLARELATSREYAIKILEKRHIIKENKVPYVTRERDVMSRLDHPFFVKLYFTFQDDEKLYAKNGELLKYIRKIGSFDETCTRFYTAEMVSALEYLHGRGIIHRYQAEDWGSALRDLKPENILLNEDMHIQITDFGTAKVLSPESKQARANSFVGTAQYVSPELLTEKSACKSSDLWALGCIIYQLVAGLPPFRAGNEYLIFQKIIKLEYDFPEKFFPKARDLVEKLLVLDATKRLGCEEMEGYGPLKAHSFFESITWENLHHQTPPKLTAYLPAMSEDDEDCYGNYDNLLSQFGCMQVSSSSSSHSLSASDTGLPQRAGSNIEQYIHDLDTNSFELDLQFSEDEKRLLLEKQASGNPWHQFVENNLILKMGPVDKRKPNRTYYLMDPSGNAHKWCKKIQEVWRHRYQSHPDTTVQ